MRHQKGLRVKVEYEVKDGSRIISSGIILADNIQHARRLISQKIASHRFTQGINIKVNGESVFTDKSIMFQTPARS